MENARSATKGSVDAREDIRRPRKELVLVVRS